MKDNEKILSFLKQQAIFQDFNKEQLLLIIDLLVEKHYAANDFILREGDRSNELYFIAEGAADVIKYDTKKENAFVIGNLKIGDMFGEMAFVDSEPRSSS